MNQSIKSNSSKGKKSQQQKDREKNIKEIKMYYWTKVDQGDRTEVVKILTFAKQNFNQENEMFEIVNCTNSDGFTPLHLASQLSKRKSTRPPLTCGAHDDPTRR